jgi:hypothetical protein
MCASQQRKKFVLSNIYFFTALEIFMRAHLWHTRITTPCSTDERK